MYIEQASREQDKSAYLKIKFFSNKTYVFGTQKNCLNETVLLSTQNKCLSWWTRIYFQFYAQFFFIINFWTYKEVQFS